MPFLPSHRLEAVQATNPSDIVGIMRFSLLLKESNFFPTMVNETYEERAARIFDNDRLRRRFEVFEDICLPSLVGQGDQKFNMILVTSQAMPVWAVERLELALKDHSNIYARAYRPKASIRRVIRRAAFEMLDQNVETIATFQLDDDDALAHDYIARLRSYIAPENIGKVITFAPGFELALANDRPQLRRDKLIKASAGLASIHTGRIRNVQEIKTIYSYGGHRKVDQVAPLIVDRDEAMYLQTANGFNVSGRKDDSPSEQDITVAEIVEILRPKYPYLNAETIERLHLSAKS